MAKVIKCRKISRKVEKICSPDGGWIEDESLTFPEEDNTGKGLSAYCAASGEFGLVIIPGRTRLVNI